MKKIVFLIVFMAFNNSVLAAKDCSDAYLARQMEAFKAQLSPTYGICDSSKQMVEVLDYAYGLLVKNCDVSDPNISAGMDNIARSLWQALETSEGSCSDKK